MRSPRIGWRVTTVALVVAAASCGGGGGTATGPTPTPGGTSTPLTRSAGGSDTTTASLSTSTTAAPSAGGPLAPPTTVRAPAPGRGFTFRPLWFADVVLAPIEVGGAGPAGAEKGIAAFGADGALRWEAPICRFEGTWVESRRVVAGPVVYLECNEELVAVSSTDGAVLWRATIAKNGVEASSNDEVLAVAAEGELRLFDARSGAVRAQRPLTSDSYGVAVEGGRVFVGDGDRLVALDPGDGHELWSTPTEVGQVVASGGSVYVLSRHRTLRAFDAASGSQIWANDEPEARMQNDALLGVAGNRLVVQTGQYIVLAFDTATGSFVWSSNDDKTKGVDVTVADPHVIVAEGGQGGSMTILDATSGATSRVDAPRPGERVSVSGGRYAYTTTKELVIVSL